MQETNYARTAFDYYSNANEFETSAAGFSEVKEDAQLVHSTETKTNTSDIYAGILFGLKVAMLATKKMFFWPLNFKERHSSFFELFSFLGLCIGGPVVSLLLYGKIINAETLFSFVCLLGAIGFFLWVPVQCAMEHAAYFVNFCKEKLEDIAEEVRTQK